MLLFSRFGMSNAGKAIVVFDDSLGYGLFGGGYTGGSYTNYTDQYTYSNNAVSAGTVLGLARQYLAACSSFPGGF